MPMDADTVDFLKRAMEWEGARAAPPAGFPDLPDIQAGRYTEARFHALERDRVFGKSWLFAGHIDELPEPGCFATWDNAGQPIVLVHGHDGKVRAFYNVCRHRGAPVVTEKRGRAPRLVCAYHNWTYKTDGRLAGVPERQDFGPGFDPACRALKAIRCERLGNLIFVNFDTDAMPLTEWFGDLLGELDEFALDRVRLAARHTFELKCNWKVAMEANMEVYHVPFIHPDTVAPLVDAKRNHNSFYANGHARMVAPAPRTTDREHVRAIDSPAGWQAIDTVGEIGRTCTQSYTLFPNMVVPMSNYFVPPLIFWPTGPDSTRLELVTMALDWGDEPAPDLWTVPGANGGRDMAPIITEDTQFGELIQVAMESDGFESVPLSYQEARIYAFHESCDRMIGAEHIPAGLAVEPTIGSDWSDPHDPRRAQIAAAEAPATVE